jgi:hypothetical protein
MDEQNDIVWNDTSSVWSVQATSQDEWHRSMYSRDVQTQTEDRFMSEEADAIVRHLDRIERLITSSQLSFWGRLLRVLGLN